MTNEWLEFKAYMDNPVFEVKSKQSSAFIGRFTTAMIKRNKGFSRIFTILARGFLFHNPDGTLKKEDAYERIAEARKFLCAWCSLPYETVENKALPYHTSFPELHDEFPQIIIRRVFAVIPSGILLQVWAMIDDIQIGIPDPDEIVHIRFHQSKRAITKT